MPHREFIHSTADVKSALRYAFESGLQVGVEGPQPTPHPPMLTRAEVADIDRGQFLLFKPEWVYGPFQIGEITGGYYRGKFSISARVNCSPIFLSFHGERIDDGRRRLGGCTVSWHRDWLEMPAKVVRETPSEVKTWYKRIIDHLSSGVVIPAGVHRYQVCKGVVADPAAADCLPPFDFIPWGADVLKARDD